MDFRYTQHLLEQLADRSISEDFPRMVFEHADIRLVDSLSGLHVAVMTTIFKRHIREIALVYRQEEKIAVLITIHPLKPGQLKNRLRSGRWVYQN